MSPRLKETGIGGNVIHKIIQSILLDSELNIIAEGDMFLPIQDINIFGHYDILMFKHENKIYCFDIKTINNFNWLDKTNEPNTHNVEQLTLYLSYLKRKYRPQTIIGCLWYFSRSLTNIIELLIPSNWRIFEISYSELTFSQLIDKALTIHQLLNSGGLPLNDAENWECSNKTATCPYFDYCFHNHITTVKQLLKLKRKRSKEN